MEIKYVKIAGNNIEYVIDEEDNREFEYDNEDTIDLTNIINKINMGSDNNG